jgi:hypothetical protein
MRRAKLLAAQQARKDIVFALRGLGLVMDAPPQPKRVAYAVSAFMLLAVVVVGAVTLVPFATRASYLPPLRILQEQVLLGAAVLLFAVLVGAALRLKSQPLPARFEHALTALAIVCATASIATAALHRPQSFDVGDDSHYVLGAKYVRELGYDKHYECVGTALRELGLNPPNRYRNLRNNTKRRLDVAPGSRAEERCHEAFSEERWAEFRNDVALFHGWQSSREIKHRFMDHGYNGTPVWSTVSGSVANAWPISEHFLTVLGLLNGVWLAAAFALLLRAFGWEMGLIYVVLFWINYADRYILGGAAFRFLPLSLLLSGAALWRLEKPKTAGACFGLAGALLVFPGLFLAAAGLYFALHLVAARGRIRALGLEARRAFEVVAAGGCTVVAAGLIAALYHGGFIVYGDFIRKMDLNSGRLADGRIGFLFNFLWPKSFTAEPLGYRRELQNLYEAHALGLTLDHLRLVLACALVVLLVFAYRRANALTFTLIVGFALFFVGFPTVRYYYMGWVALPLALHAAPSALSSRLVLGVFALMSALCFALDRHVTHGFLHNTLLTMGFTAILVALAVPQVAAAISAGPLERIG